MGSTSYITNLDGDVVQHIEYVPFGEVFLEERNNKWNTPYLFNAKELDEETGLYYYGARYYDPRVSLWLGIDPMQEKYPNKTSYHYCSNNPVNMIDPDGRDDIYNLKGKRIERTPNGSEIKVRVANKDISLAKLDFTSQENRNALSAILGYYVEDAGISCFAEGMVPIGNTPRGTVGLKEHDNPSSSNRSMAFATGGNIWINIEGGKIEPSLSNANNLISALVHENAHKTARHGEKGDKTPKIDAEKVAYSAQVSHSSYSKTTKDFQFQVVGGYASYLKDSKAGYDSIQKRVEDFNSLLPKNSHYKLQFKPNFQSFDVKIIETK